MKVDKKRGERILAVKNVVATMAIEDMYLSETMKNNFIELINGTKTTEEIRKELIKKYAR